jgi:hypothetical protein
MNNLHRLVDKIEQNFAVVSVYAWVVFFVSVVLSVLLGMQPHNFVVLSLGVIAIVLFCVTATLAIVGSLVGKTPDKR